MKLTTSKVRNEYHVPLLPSVHLWRRGGGHYTQEQDLNMGVKSFTSSVNKYCSLPVHFTHFFIDEFKR